MVHLTLLLGREVVGVYTFTKTEITVGRDPDMDRERDVAGGDYAFTQVSDARDRALRDP